MHNDTQPLEPPTIEMLTAHIENLVACQARLENEINSLQSAYSRISASLAQTRAQLIQLTLTTSARPVNGIDHSENKD